MLPGTASRFALVLGVSLAGFYHARAQRKEPSTAMMPGWMAGCWVARNATDTLEEFWTVPRASTMLGIARLVHKDSLVTFEQNRIAVRASRIVLESKVEAEPAREYTAIELAPEQVIFDARPTGDERIRYRRDGDTLWVRFARYRDSTVSGVEESMRLVSCEHQ